MLPLPFLSNLHSQAKKCSEKSLFDVASPSEADDGMLLVGTEGDETSLHLHAQPVDKKHQLMQRIIN